MYIYKDTTPAKNKTLAKIGELTYRLFMTDLREIFIAEVKHFIDAHEFTAGTLSTAALGCNKIVPRVLAGGNCTLKTADTVRHFMNGHAGEISDADTKKGNAQ